MTRPEISPDEILESLGPYFFVQRKAGHRLTGDTLSLAEFAIPTLTDKDTVIDLGTGTGALPLLFAWKTKVRRITGVEIDAGTAATANKNVSANGIEHRVEILKRDYRELKSVYPEGAFSVVVSNPPYTKAGTGRISPKKERAGARAELFGGLSDLIDISAYLAGGDGRVFYVFPKARLSEMLEGLGRAGLDARRVRFISSKPGKEPDLFLIEAGRGGGLRIET
ncbi:MAG TPA: methyltransferase [Thermodesulfobacteriota bacterium]